MHWEGLARRRWRSVLALALLGTVLASASVLQRGTSYRATTTVAVQSPLDGAGTSPPSADQLQAEIDLAGSAVVRAAAVQDLSGKVTLSTTSSANSGVLTFVATTSTATAAVQAADAYAAAYQEIKKKTLLGQYDAAISSLQQAVTALQTRRAASGTESEKAALDGQIKAYAASLQDLLLQRELVPSRTPQVVAPAGRPISPVPSHLVAYVLIGAAAGFVVGLALAALAEHRDDAIRDPEGLVAAYRQSALTADFLLPPLVISLPAHRGRRRLLRRPATGAALPLAAAGTAAANWYGLLRASLDTRLSEPGHGVVLVASAVGEDGAVTVALNLAAAFARTQRSTVLLELGVPDRIGPALGLAPELGAPTAVDVILGEAELVDALRPTNLQADLFLTSVGTGPLPLDQLGTAGGDGLLTQLREQAVVTVVAAPPLVSHPEVPVLAGLVDRVVLVAQAGVTRERDVRLAVDALFQIGAELSALVLTDAGPRQGGPDGQAPTTARRSRTVATGAR